MVASRLFRGFFSPSRRFYIVLFSNFSWHITFQIYTSIQRCLAQRKAFVCFVADRPTVATPRSCCRLSFSTWSFQSFQFVSGSCNPDTGELYDPTDCLEGALAKTGSGVQYGFAC